MKERKFVWEPYGDYVENSRVARFMKKHGIATWQELIKRSTEDIAWFWPAALEDLGVEWFKKYERLFDDSRGMPWTKWFCGGKINITHNCLDRHIRDGKGEKVALLWEGDEGERETITYRELYDRVNILTRALRRNGVKKGDVVAMCMSVSPDAVAVMFAAMKIGAVCMQIAARSAPTEVAENLQRGKAKVLFVDDMYVRGGKMYELTRTIETALRDVRSLRKVIMRPHDNYFFIKPEIAGDKRFTLFSEFLAQGCFERAPRTSRLDAERPALILFSSGTTGKSKAVVHTHAGALAQIVKEAGYAFDCRAGDVFYWFTNFGWMMAPWEIIGALFFGATVALYEGTHLYPTPHRIFELIEKHKVTIFGFTPTAMRSIAKLNEDFSRHNLSSLRILGSTGEPLDRATWTWFFETFGQKRCPIMNISGGTEIIGCHLSPLPIMPQKPGSLGGAGLGMDIAAYDEEGKEVERGSGYLVCRKPFPSMTKGFLGESERYIDTYFSKWHNIWFHGDRVEKDADGFWYVLGRADDLIVRGGVKHDPSKIEAACILFPGSPRVKEAAVIGAKDKELGERIVCFVVLEEDGLNNHETLNQALRAHVGKVYDPMGRPDEIHIVRALPKNVAAKIPRALIKKAYEGGELGDIFKIDNPDV